MSSIISVDRIGKRYRLNGTGAPAHDTLRDLVASLASRRRRLAVGGGRTDFWALRDVSFDVRPGEVLGIVGRNGAGKSTLLKILSRITTPTEGEAVLNGRVASLLEVGTGFHAELTGRENVFFNGAILGLRKHEIRARFDEIIAFSGIEQFIDTPIKRYSSGMKMRLAFSVAAHLEPEIMIIDEVLAVGDVDFQKKCLGKMREVSKSGRTVLFVSHNINTVMDLCSRILWLQDGVVIEDTIDVRRACRRYLFGDNQNKASSLYSATQDGPLDNEFFSLVSMGFFDKDGIEIVGPVANDQYIALSLRILIKKYDSALNFGIAVIDESGNQIFWSLTTDVDEASWPHLCKGENILHLDFPRRLLNEGEYRIEFIASRHAQGWLSEPGKTAAHIKLTIQGGLSDSPYLRRRRPPLLVPVMKWTSECV